jgi:hypothetical protein
VLDFFACINKLYIFYIAFIDSFFLVLQINNLFFFLIHIFIVPIPSKFEWDPSTLLKQCFIHPCFVIGNKKKISQEAVQKQKV